MSRLVSDLEVVLQGMVDEHAKLLAQLEAQQAAMRRLDLRGMDAAAGQQEAIRLRLAGLDGRRRSLVQQIARAHRMTQQITVAEIASMYPVNAAKLTGLRDALKRLIGQVQARAQVAGRLAGAVVGHLNTAVRLLAGAVEKAGVYTPQGVPKVSARIGVMEAVG